MFVSLLLAGGAFAVVAWLIFNLSVFALPAFVGVGAASFAYRGGAGVVGAGLVGLAVGASAFALGRIAFEKAGSASTRGVLAIVYAAPAAVAGFYSTCGIVELFVAAHGWREAFSIAGALVTAIVACRRLAALAPSARTGETTGSVGSSFQGGTVGRAAPYPVVSVGTRGGIIRRRNESPRYPGR
jgi:hypothetical protein